MSFTNLMILCALSFSFLATVLAGDAPIDYSYDLNEPPVTTDISCWMGNSRITSKYSLERCNLWITYNSTKVIKGSACISAEYTVDGEKYYYKNCSYSVSVKHDPCEALILAQTNPRVYLHSCNICWDNGCNRGGRVQKLSGWYWYLLMLLLLCCLGFFVAFALRFLCKGLFQVPCYDKC